MTTKKRTEDYRLGAIGGPAVGCVPALYLSNDQPVALSRHAQGPRPVVFSSLFSIGLFKPHRTIRIPDRSNTHRCVPAGT